MSVRHVSQGFTLRIQTAEIQGYRSSVCRFSLDGCKCKLPNHLTIHIVHQRTHYFTACIGRDVASWSLCSTLPSNVWFVILEDSTIQNIQCDQPILFKILRGAAGLSSERRSKTAHTIFFRGLTRLRSYLVLFHVLPWQTQLLLVCRGATIHGFRF